MTWKEIKLNVLPHFRVMRSLVCINLLIIVSSATSYSQYNLSIGTNYVRAFGERSVDFQNETFNLNPTHGFEITANNSYRFQHPDIETLFNIGFRQLYFSGSSTNVIYSGQQYKLITSIGTGYYLTEKFRISGAIEVENNRALEDFNIGDGDLFRVCLSLQSSYFLSDRFGLNVLVSRAMTPITEAYILTNPQYQVRFGLMYKIIK